MYKLNVRRKMKKKKDEEKKDEEKKDEEQLHLNNTLIRLCIFNTSYFNILTIRGSSL